MTVTGQVEEMIATLENGLNDAAKHDRGNANDDPAIGGLSTVVVHGFECLTGILGPGGLLHHGSSKIKPFTNHAP